ncbi:FIG00953737: hypothetical protein [plant metagenome]|uniref:PhoD-like phosphatase metallophosphatase domain-containing protein n=1 Tax=plant metagenome TaxID=1297885 RepID=A0A484UK87_9ZZZZ
MPADSPLPDVLAGPILRRLTPDRLLIWLVGSRPLPLSLSLHAEGDAEAQVIALSERHCRAVAVGRLAWIHYLDVRLDTPLPQDTRIAYDLRVRDAGDGEQGIAHWAPHLLADDGALPHFVLRPRVDNLLYGSCRKPHTACPDALAHVDGLLAAQARPQDMPAMMMLCGDQVYADDVAGPSLVAIHALIRKLGLYGECLEGGVVKDSAQLYTHPDTYYRREALLPDIRANEALRERFFGGVRKPIFTTSSAHNHLITLAEVLAMYLLAWSPTAWEIAGELAPPALSPEHANRWAKEKQSLAAFVATLPRAARAMAHVQTLMIFDDHDVTDDWNLSAQWETCAYGHPFSRRIVGNALAAYALCQGWGNRPDAFGQLLDAAQALTGTVDGQGRIALSAHDHWVDTLLAFDEWHYVLDTQPKLVVLNTRTQRWRNRRLPGQPSGLMDWESLSALQQDLLGEESAIIVSPAPMFGVKLIEVVQRLFTWAGHPLMVDAENWMAHRGAAQVMMNIFRHTRTPGNYVILSGDVHYSFVYDIHIRDREDGPRLWQITSSGMKNEFPRRLLDWLDRANRWLYSPRSPLNWLTKRRHLDIDPRVPDRARAGERLWNGAGIGQVWLDAQGRPSRIVQHNADGSPATCFVPRGTESLHTTVTEPEARV